MLALPAVVSRLADVVLGAGCFDSTVLRLFQYPDDLLLAESPLHFVLLLLLEQNYTFQLSSFWGSGHLFHSISPNSRETNEPFLASPCRFRNYIRFMNVRCYFKAITPEAPQWLRKDRLLLR